MNLSDEILAHAKRKLSEAERHHFMTSLHFHSENGLATLSDLRAAFVALNVAEIVFHAVNHEVPHDS